MKKPVLVVMAAGMGSRYGGLKQIDPVDKEGHIIMDFSIYDAADPDHRGQNAGSIQQGQDHRRAEKPDEAGPADRLCAARRRADHSPGQRGQCRRPVCDQTSSSQSRSPPK